MKTIILDENKIDLGGKIIRDGGLVAFPTETVYGLGANGLNPKAVEKIFIAKARPIDNPLILHISSIEAVNSLAKNISKNAKLLMESFWPGPLTLILEKSELVPDIITGGLNTVAIRVPNNPIALKLIKASGFPLAAPSANISGRPSPTNFQHVYKDMYGKIDAIIDGGKTNIGIESTVLDMTSQIPTILRPGNITLEILKKYLPNVIEDPGLNNNKPKSPGQKYKHYAPKGELFIFNGQIDRIIERIRQEGNFLLDKGINFGIIATEESKDYYKFPNILVVGSRKDKTSIAHNLFNVLREFDDLEVDIILGEGISEEEIGSAIMDRLVKASGGKIINV